MGTPRLSWPLLPVGVGALFSLVTMALTWAEYETYNSTSLDMAVYTQLVWNVAQGRPFETTLLLQNRVHLAEHLALLLLPIAPLYALIPSVKMLLLLQQAALALSGLPVYLWARQRLGCWLALVVLVGYYAMPTIGEVALDAFYPIVFAALPLGWALKLALERRVVTAVAPALLAQLIEEEAALAVLGLGVFVLLFRIQSRPAGLALAIAGGLWLLGTQLVVMPSYAIGETRPETHFGRLREQPLEWLATVVLTRLEPELLRDRPVSDDWPRPEPCSQPGQCSALRWWLYPTGGLALLSPSTLVPATPTAAALLLADRPGRFRRHWAAPLLPIIWLATIEGLARLRGSRSFPLGVTLLVASSVLMYRLDGSLPLGAQYETSDIVPTARSAELQQLGSLIPDGANVGASRRGLAHLANRERLYVFPPEPYGSALWPPREWPCYVLLDLSNAESAREAEQLLSTSRSRPRFRVVTRTPHALLVRREGCGPAS